MPERPFGEPIQPAILAPFFSNWRVALLAIRSP
jgi:hypothetical protein